jgi:hypothetical protein
LISNPARAVLTCVAAALLCGCARESSPPAQDGDGPAVTVVRRAYLPRLVSEDWWETIRRAEAGPEFLLLIHPLIKTPAEGPWTATFLDPAGRVFAAHHGLRVDVATGQFTFLCRSEMFVPGDWAIELEVEEGGLVAGERKRSYRFRVE